VSHTAPSSLRFRRSLCGSHHGERRFSPWPIGSLFVRSRRVGGRESCEQATPLTPGARKKIRTRCSGINERIDIRSRWSPSILATERVA
jgi:hypothetical protein